jgi:hypothetical protein
MSRLKSIEAMRNGLDDSVSLKDWKRARQYIDRLRGIVVDSLVQDDPVAIRHAGSALKLSGERIELLSDLPMVIDHTALAWQLRADASMAALAASVRPLRDDIASSDALSRDVSTLLMRTLSLANGPMSNTSLANQTGKDPSVVSRTLKRLERDGLVRRWRGASAQQLNAPISPEVERPETQNRQRLTGDPYTDVEAIKKQVTPNSLSYVQKFEILDIGNENAAKLGGI